MAESARSGEKVFRGIPASVGICCGKVVVLGKRDEAIPRWAVPETELGQQVERVEQALIQTRQQVLEIQRQVTAAMGAADASIFEAHLLVLEDRVLIDEVSRLIQEQKVNAEFAFSTVADRYLATLSAVNDEYLRERVADMRDVIARVLGNLMGRPDENLLRGLAAPGVVISHDLTPSSTALLDKKMVLGFATDVGSKTSHTAILARSLQIPAVVGLHDISEELVSGQSVLVDGFNGLVILNPTDQTLFEHGQLARRQVTLQEKLRAVQTEPAVTLDGTRLVLSANVEQAADTEAVLACGAEGVGLFRTEYLFIHRDALPSEEEQYLAYRQVAAALKPHPVVIRTLDLGGDKFLSHLPVPKEMNPFLGWRAIRFCLQELSVFRTQLRAILRASTEGNIKMMYPMISGLEELNQANALVQECKAALRAENIPFDPALEVGAMIEIPSAVMVADSLAKRVKFFSLGTNDLIQYTLAVDRMNERIAHLYEPTHPAILQLIRLTVEAAHRNGIWAGVCGEVAGDPVLAPLLLGLGVDELSAAPPLVPSIKFLVRRTKLSEAKELAEFALNCESPAEILARSQAFAHRVAPGLFNDQTEPAS
ncbi:MAG: phosphoenolpyruvate--protein phosphotransferase [Verrucomicrobia bacterium]|nr:phosphoenolpyruvate--protein phosphotransferase [Verrucomicrobiota bacterium]